jgi:CDGSH-type Zn-finger protein
MINTADKPMRSKAEVVAGETTWFCRCWQSNKFPYCDSSHHKVNKEHGDNVGPLAVTGVAAES